MPSSYRGDPYWTSARFSSECKGCRRTIRKGEPIFYYPRGKHVFCDSPNCGKRESASFSSAVADEDFYNRSNPRSRGRRRNTSHGCPPDCTCGEDGVYGCGHAGCSLCSGVEHPCVSCGKELGNERFLGTVHGVCARREHARATGGRVSKGRVVWGGSRRRRRNTGGREVDETAATELELFIDNDHDLYKGQFTSIVKNLMRKRRKGTYNHALAAKLFGYLVESGAKKYDREFGGGGSKWHETFDVPTRTAVARSLADKFKVEADLGNYDGVDLRIGR